ncbi:MAG TPA: hypothetical protein VH092_30870 [Urbifossiella sp.]|jgi:hypothetical protein|nr:hypothetical protein [Urbifossiella sp.]
MNPNQPPPPPAGRPSDAVEEILRKMDDQIEQIEEDVRRIEQIGRDAQHDPLM